MKKTASICLFIAVISFAVQENHSLPQEKNLSPLGLDIPTIENRLIEQVNRERKKQNLTPLFLSPRLSYLARIHSKDMAANARLSHLSSSRKSYQERLVEEGLYFMDIGENVAFSETFQAEFIHQSLMESAGHRENILNPKFDQVGIGIIYKKNKGYYLTQDFLRSFNIRKNEQIKEEILRKINAYRRAQSLLYLSYREDAEEFANLFSWCKAKGIPVPRISDTFGENHVVFFASPSLDKMDSTLKNILHSIYKTASIGVHVGRDKNHPGGTYFITLLLFPEIKYTQMGPEEFAKIMAQTLNNIRQKQGLESLKLDENLSQYANQISLISMTKKDNQPAYPPGLKKNAVYSYLIKGPYFIPEKIKEKIKNPLIEKVGVGITFGRTPKIPRGGFFVTIILDNESLSYNPLTPFRLQEFAVIKAKKEV